MQEDEKTGYSEVQIRVVQVLTLIGSKGEYGGPVRVAFEISDALSENGVENRIVAGIHQNEFEIETSYNVVQIPVKTYLSQYRFSSLWGRRALPILVREIRNSDVVHVHFARDLIPIAAALLALLLQKKLYLQTHGMIRKDNRLTIRIVDWIIIRRIVKRCRFTLALQNQEYADLLVIGVPNLKLKVFPNGFKIKPSKLELSIHRNFKVIFLARLAPVKNVIIFAQLARIAANANLAIDFEVYGPDGGSLTELQSFIEGNSLGTRLTYKGPIPPIDVLDLLSRSDVLVLPSSYDPFPISILEALSCGCSVLVMPSCGISGLLRELDENFVARIATPEGLFEKIQSYGNVALPIEVRKRNQSFIRQNFDMENVIQQLLDIYRR